MARKPDPAAVLAEKLLGALEAARSQGVDAYPAPLDRLRQLTGADASPELTLKALGKQPLKGRILAAPKKSPTALVVLHEDAGRLAQSPQLLELLLEAACTPLKPSVPLTTLKIRLDTPLKKPFEEAVQRSVREGSLPASIRSRTVGKRLELYLARMPPPPEPPIELAQKLVRTLEQERERGAGYPLSLRRLLELAAPAAGTRLVGQALAAPEFATRAELGLKSTKTKPALDSPVALTTDRDRLAASPLLLDAALRAARTKTRQAAAPAALAGKVAVGLKPSFLEHLSRLLEANHMPPGFGWLALGRTKQIFLIEDAHLGSDAVAAPVAPPAPPATTDLGRLLEEAFQRLDHAAGGHNFVNLAALRREVPLDRTAFDRELHQLRLAGRYTLSAAEGRHGLKPDEREAGILEDGSLLLFVSRKLASTSP